MLLTPRDYQTRAIEDIAAEFRRGRRAVLLVLPCGSGKTFIFVLIAKRAAAKGNRTLILVHRKELLFQASRTLDSMGVDHGLIAPGIPFTDSMVQVASVQTIVRRLNTIPWQPEMIIVDEAHHSIRTSTWGNVIDHYGVHLLGVTASPERLSGEGLGVNHQGFFEVMIVGPSPSELIGMGHLSPPVVYAPGGRPDVSSIHTRAGEFAREEAGILFDKPTITGDVIAHYRRHCNGEPAIAFCCSVKHAENVAEQFRAEGFRAASIDGKINDADRNQRVTDLSTGQLNVLTSCDVVSEGFDAPVVSAAILLRPTKSLGIFVQQTGRALRPFPSKTHATILDHVGNTFIHDLPDADREWSLDARKRSKRNNREELPIRQCHECYFVHRPAPVCPKCGYIYPVKPRTIEEVDGDLEKVNADQVRRAMKREQGMARSLEDLQRIGRERGYKPGWAYFTYRARHKRGVEGTTKP